MTKIILVRHGHVEGISPERFRGRADLALTAEGRRQAEATARRIEASWTPAAYASPLEPGSDDRGGDRKTVWTDTGTVAALREVIGRHANDTVVVVGHDSVNRAILLHALDLPLSRYRRLGQDPCAINEIDFTAGEFTVRSVDETFHLKEQR